MFYGAVLAHTHDAGYGDVAAAAAAELLARDPGDGLVVDLGCGSGILAEALQAAGRPVHGIDRSADFLEIARRRAPQATFVQGDAFTAEIPPCQAVTSSNEALSYDDAPLDALFARVAAALPENGLFLFDVLERVEARHGWKQGEDWLVCATSTIDGPALTREIVSFWREGDLWRRSDETHHQYARARAAVQAALERAGFDVELIHAYAGLRIRDGVAGFAARRR